MRAEGVEPSQAFEVLDFLTIYGFGTRKRIATKNLLSAQSLFNLYNFLPG